MSHGACDKNCGRPCTVPDGVIHTLRECLCNPCRAEQQRRWRDRPPVALDLKFNLEHATARLQRERDEAIERIRRTFEEMASQLSAAADLAHEGTDVGNLQTADHVVVQDFEVRGSGATEIGVGYGWGNPIPMVRLAEPIRAGKYRAVILVTRRPPVTS